MEPTFSTKVFKLKKIKKINVNYDILQKAINDVNRVVHLTYLFTRGFLVYYFTVKNEPIDEQNNNNDNILFKKYLRDNPELNIKIDKNFISFMMKIIMISTTTGGPPIQEQKYHELVNIYWDIFTKETDIQKIKVSNISFILAEHVKEIHTNIINNIQNHLGKHISCYLKLIKNSLYNNDTIIPIKQITNDILNSITTKYDTDEANISVYMLNKFKPKILQKYDYIYCIKNDLCTMLEFSFKLNKYIAALNTSAYQFFPIKHSNYYNHIYINTCALIDLYVKNKPIIKKKLYTKGELIKFSGEKFVQNYIWNSVFNLNKIKYLVRGTNTKQLHFNYELSTDNYSVCINCVHDSYIDTLIKSKNRKKNGLKKYVVENKTKEDKKATKLLKETHKQEKEIERAQERKRIKEENKTKRDNLNKLKETDLEKYKHTIKEIKQYKENEKKKLIESKLKNLDNNDTVEYIDTLLYSQDRKNDLLNKYNNGKVLFIDPGVRDILCGMCKKFDWNKLKESNDDLKLNYSPEQNHKLNSNDNFGIRYWKGYKMLSYTAKTRAHYCGFKTNRKGLEILKKDKSKGLANAGIGVNKTSIEALESKLSITSSKSCIPIEFMKYVRLKCIVYDELMLSDYNFIYKMKYRAYIKKQRHTNNLLNIIENEFGKDIVIIIGDWSGKGSYKRKSTPPNQSLTRLLRKRFMVMYIDEFNTSKIHYKTDTICTKMKKQLNAKEVERLKNKYNDRIIKTENDHILINKYGKLPNELIDSLKNKNLSKNLIEFIDAGNMTNTQRIPLKKELHGVLSFKKDEPNRPCIQGCINRDINACLNFERLVLNYLKTNERIPVLKYVASVKQKKIKKRTKRLKPKSVPIEPAQKGK